MDSEHKPTRRGRPRDPKVDAAILATTRSLLGSEGYARMTVESVAKTAGVSRPTVYLRWPSKEELVIAAIGDLERPEISPATGDTKADLIAILRDVQKSFFDHGNSRIIGPLHSEQKHAPRLLAEFRSRLLVPRRNSVRRIIERGIETGDVDSGIDVGAMVDAIVGSMYAKLMATDDVEPGFAEAVINSLWCGLAVRP